jgi:hypothetical protein
MVHFRDQEAPLDQKGQAYSPPLHNKWQGVKGHAEPIFIPASVKQIAISFETSGQGEHNRDELTSPL